MSKIYQQIMSPFTSVEFIDSEMLPNGGGIITGTYRKCVQTRIDDLRPATALAVCWDSFDDFLTALYEHEKEINNVEATDLDDFIF